MSTNRRAIRRHERQRIFAKRKKQNRLHVLDIQSDTSWVEKDARRRIDTGKICSCHLCGNTRRYHGNSKRTLTRQELNALYSFNLCE